MLLLVNILHTHDNTRLRIQIIYPGCDKFEQIKFESLNQYTAKMKTSGTYSPILNRDGGSFQSSLTAVLGEI